MKKWIEAAWDGSDDDNNNNVVPSPTSWFLPASLNTLFGGDGATEPNRPVNTTGVCTYCQQALNEQACLMELLQAEYSDEPPDNGALEGSGNDFK